MTLVSLEAVQQRVDLVWHGVNDPLNLHRFLESPIRWGECDVRLDPLGRIVLRHDGFNARPRGRGEEHLTLDEWLAACARRQKSVKLDLKEGRDLVERVSRLVAEHGFSGNRVWFNAAAGVIGERGFRWLAAGWPGAVRQVPIHLARGPIAAARREARELFAALHGWGITRFSVDWTSPSRLRELELLEEWGYEANLYNVPDLESFLRAALLLPASLTSDFNFPEWRLFGRGSGKDGVYHEYGPGDVAPASASISR